MSGAPGAPADAPQDPRCEPEASGSQPRFGHLLLEAAGLETTELERFLERIAEDDRRMAGELRRRLEVSMVPATFMGRPAGERLGGDPLGGVALGVDEPGGGSTETSYRAGATTLAHPLSPPPADAFPGSSVGDGATFPAMAKVSERYALGACLGEGGMGRVFEAFDRKLQRTVALKLLTRNEAGHALRLLHEARAQARVRHTNVLEIYDTGELQGRPYIAMGLVVTGSLHDLAEQLSLERRVRLLAEAADGLHAAHLEGLVHRDVKPSNILVDELTNGELRAYVADFGIATEPEASSETHERGLVGTPSYIAPELLLSPRPPVDRRTDVFSFGMTAYEVLTGHRPFDATDGLAILQRRLKGEHPPPPRERSPSLPVELEAIILHCLRDDPNERYPTLEAAADDLRRFLAGKVVAAYTSGVAYRVTRFVQRHRLLVSLAAVALVAVLVGSVATAFFAFSAEKERQRAENRRGQAEDLVHFMVVDLREKLREVGRLDILDGVHEKALEYFAAVPAEEMTDAELARQAQTLYQIGDVHIRRGELAEAVPPLRLSLAMARQLAERHPEDGSYLFDLGQSHFWLGYAHYRQGDSAAALPPFEDYLEVSKRLVEMDPSNPDWLLELSYAHSNLGSVHQRLGNLELALGHFEATATLDEQLAVRSPDDLELRFERAGTHNSIGVLLLSLGRLEEAEEHLTLDVELKRSLVGADPSNYTYREYLASSLNHYGHALGIRGRFEEAESILVEARTLFLGLMEHDPTNNIWQYSLAWSHLRFAEMALRQGRADEGWQPAEEAIELLESLLEQQPEIVDWRRSLGIAFYLRARLRALHDGPTSADESRDDALRALDLLQNLADSGRSGRTDYWTAETLVLLGRLAAEHGESAQARDSWQRSVRILEPHLSKGWGGPVRAAWVEALNHLGQEAEARSAFAELGKQGYVDPDLGLAPLPRRAPAGAQGRQRD